MKINKIIFITESRLSRRDYDRFGIDLIKKNGFVVEVWEFTPILHKNVFSKLGESDCKEEDCYKLFNCKKDAVNAINKLEKSCFIICLIGYNLKTYPFYKVISGKKIAYGVFFANALPFPDYKFNVAKIRRAIKLLTEPRKLIKKLTKSAGLDTVLRFMKVNPAKIALLGGEKSFDLYSKFYPVNELTEKLWLHSLDYDLYLKEKNNPINPEVGKFAVFLDEYLSFHSDYLFMDSSPFSSAQDYYPPLCRFFSHLENKLGIKIIIAAHPRSNYEEHPDYFEGRIVIKGKTAELIRNSEFVIAHASTSVNMAVLFGKSIIFITTHRLAQGPLGPRINLLAELLGKKAINVENVLDISIDDEFRINELVYLRYRNNYIKKDGSEDLPFWQVFCNRMKLIEV